MFDDQEIKRLTLSILFSAFYGKLDEKEAIRKAFETYKEIGDIEYRSLYKKP